MFFRTHNIQSGAHEKPTLILFFGPCPLYGLCRNLSYGSTCLRIFAWRIVCLLSRSPSSDHKASTTKTICVFSAHQLPVNLSHLKSELSRVTGWLHTHMHTQIPERLNLIPGSTGLSITCGICLRIIDRCWSRSQRRVKNAGAARQVRASVGVSVWQVRSEYKEGGPYLVATDLSG